jgi:predicted tellurium resistance membrane protein TerC
MDTPFASLVVIGQRNRCNPRRHASVEGRSRTSRPARFPLRTVGLRRSVPPMAFAPTADDAIALLTLTALEIILGIDNVIFLAVLVQRLPAQQRALARLVGLALAMIARIGLLFAIAWVMRLTEPWFTAFGHPISAKDAILIAGGLFLIWKSTTEIVDRRHRAADIRPASHRGFASVLAQIVALDAVFSLDSVITAVGMAEHLWVMIVAVVVAVLVMMVFSGAIVGFIERHPGLKTLALSFLLLIGVMLVADGFGQHIQKGYLYFAMGFSFLVELLNIRRRKRQAREGGATSETASP